MKGSRIVSLNDFVWFQRGFDLPKNKFENGNVPVYGSTSILGFHNVSKVKAPGIVTGRSGTLGQFQYANEDFWPHNTTLWIKDFKGNEPRFVYYLLQCLDFSLFNSGGAVPTLNRNVLNAFKVNVPSINTQKHIASILSVYDDLIENNLKRIKLLEELGQRTYEEWFVKFRINGILLKLNKETALPEGWQRKKIGEVLKTSSGGTPSRKKDELYYKNGSIPWIKTKELNNTIIIDSEEKITKIALKESSAKLFPPKTVLLAMYGNTIGQTAYLSISASTNQACCAFVSEDKEYRSYFIHQYLLNNKELILNYRMGAAQENISQEIIKAIEIIMPKESTLVEFGKLIEPIYSQTTNLWKQNRLLKESRDILLPKLMSGVIEVK